MPEYQDVGLFLHVLKLILIPEGLLLDPGHKLKIQVEHFSSLFYLVQIADASFDSVHDGPDGALTNVCLFGQVENEVAHVNALGSILELLLYFFDEVIVPAVVLLHGLYEYVVVLVVEIFYDEVLVAGVGGEYYLFLALHLLFTGSAVFTQGRDASEGLGLAVTDVVFEVLLAVLNLLPFEDLLELLPLGYLFERLA